MGGRFKREGTYVYLWLIHVEVWQKQQNPIKQLSFNKKLKKKKVPFREKDKGHWAGRQHDWRQCARACWDFHKKWLGEERAATAGPVTPGRGPDEPLKVPANGLICQTGSPRLKKTRVQYCEAAPPPGAVTPHAEKRATGAVSRRGPHCRARRRLALGRRAVGGGSPQPRDSLGKRETGIGQETRPVVLGLGRRPRQREEAKPGSTDWTRGWAAVTWVMESPKSRPEARAKGSRSPQPRIAPWCRPHLSIFGLSYWLCFSGEPWTHTLSVKF